MQNEVEKTTLDSTKYDSKSDNNILGENQKYAENTENNIFFNVPQE